MNDMRGYFIFIPQQKAANKSTLLMCRIVVHGCERWQCTVQLYRLVKNIAWPALNRLSEVVHCEKHIVCTAAEIDGASRLI